VRVERGLRFAAALDTSDALNNAIVAASSNPSSAPDLHAEDVVRGYVLDVHDNASGSWRTVCARTGKYHFPTVASNQDVAVTEEAAVDSPPTGPADPKDPRRFHLQQSLVRWDGWSLAAPHPGLPITSHDSVTQDPPEPPAFPVDYQLHATALPRLRFGTSYAMRMRAVDLAGNAPGLGSTPAVGDPGQRVTAESRYLRFEPVPSPDIEVREDPVPGESLHRLVIRGNYDADSIENALRFVIPPRAAELLCEHHGMFDVQSTPGHTVLDKNAYNLIASRESAHYDPDQPVDPTSGVPYLPDPISRGAAVRVLDGPQANSVFSDMTFSPGGGHAWPENRPFVLRVEHGDVPLWQQDDSGRLLRVRLTKADVIRIRLSSTITRSDLDLLGQHGWVKDHLAPQGPTTGYVGDAIAGQHWLTTPYRELTLVYAVRQPLTPPALADVGPNRPTGATFSAVGGTLGFDGKSTGKLEMRARWNEPVDGGPGAPPPSGPGAPDGAGRNVEVQAFNVPIDAQLLNDHRFAERHEFGDTKHRKVAYQAIATSKFTDHFVEHATATAAQGATQQLSAIGLEPRSVTVTSPDGTTRYREDVDFTVDAGAGSVTFLKDAGPVRLTFFPPVSRSTPPLPAVVKDPYTPNVLPILDIPSSARPLAPQIAFVIPIFKWSPVTKSGSKLQSSRSPSALRVFLERPWWSSGVDELLGVVTWPGAEGPGAGTIPKEIAPFVTDWGRDPVFNSAALPSPHPRLGAFPASPAPFRATGRTLDEVAGQLVNVAGHAVAYDPARQLWYSDVQIAAGAAYTPVIRLALARYQPHSVPGVELSRVVLADFMQVAPGRAVTVTTKKGAIGSVTLSGPSYSKAAKALGGPGFARAILEMRDAAIADDVVGWVQVGSPHTMKPVRGARGGAAWVAHDIPLPSRGSFRLVVEQYEELPADARGRGPAGPGRRLVFSDVIPLKP
ncbi:MAG: hypothetical protein QOG63_2594, partial [Thermoleophilaceae bacterium]|nr:hypothetical protein [Thermoleophilaceae bacterium]